MNQEPTPFAATLSFRLVVTLSTIVIAGCSSGGGGGGGNVNQPPVANNGCTYYPDLTQNPLAGMLSATDPEGQSLSYSIVPGSSGMKGQAVVTSPMTGAFAYTPNANSRGMDTFTYEVTDGNLTAQGTYQIVYTPRIMPLGDSITQGVTSSGQPAENNRVGYRKPLKDALAAANYQTDFVGTLANGIGAGLTDPEHDGHGACTADELAAGTGPCAGMGGGVASWLNIARPDVVLLHVGTNDISNAMGFDPDDVNDVETILNTIDAWEATNWPVTVIVSRIITNRMLATAETTAFNNAVQTMVLSRTTDKLELVDHQPNVSPADYGDLLHPSSGGYQKMANVWLWPLSGDSTISTASGNHVGPGILPKCP